MYAGTLAVTLTDGLVTTTSSNITRTLLLEYIMTAVDSLKINQTKYEKIGMSANAKNTVWTNKVDLSLMVSKPSFYLNC